MTEEIGLYNELTERVARELLKRKRSDKILEGIIKAMCLSQNNDCIQGALCDVLNDISRRVFEHASERHPPGLLEWDRCMDILKDLRRFAFADA